MGLKERAVLKDDHERDDQRQSIIVLLAAIQRERSRADQFYTRARNLLAYSTALFVAVQTAFLTSLGRERNGQLILASNERHHVAVAATFALSFLIIGTILLFGFADRAREMDAVSGNSVLDVLEDPNHEYQEIPVLPTLVAVVAAEERAWSTNNKRRGQLNLGLAVLCVLAALATLAELILLYSGLA